MSKRQLQVINSSGELTEIKLGSTDAGSKLLTSDEIAALLSSNKTTVSAGAGLLQSGVPDVNPTIYVASHAGLADSIGTLVITADSIGVALGETNTTAAKGNHTHSGYLTGTKVDSFNSRTGAVTLTKADVESVLTGEISSHTHDYPAPGEGTVTEVTSATEDQLTVADGTSTPALSILIGGVANGQLGLVRGQEIYTYINTYTPKPHYANGYVVSGSGLPVPVADTWVKVPSWTWGPTLRMTKGGGEIISEYSGDYKFSFSGSFNFTTTSGLTTSTEVRLALFINGVEKGNLECQVTSDDSKNISFAVNGIQELQEDDVISIRVRAAEPGTFTLGYGAISVNLIAFERL